ncbi:2-oxoglutarate-dependent dioxygenase [Melia azedarach]|uniref:2-oxoglutarate-dependent dioxygenase n=1 Tax=Melia azedarach TaxID=155640 RepID=A0ACC1Y3P9_MELAZ|nr:2-oxoglutarate-dependent dioxygenase [Melia azedarach]
MGSETTSKLPVVDLTKENLKPGSSSWQSTCNEIRLALEEYGCFVALYDLSSNFRKKVFDSLEELFDLPQETKMKNVNPKPAHGYMGKISAFPLHEGMGIEYATNPEECEKFTKLMWPEGNDQFCETAHSYANIVAELQQLVMRMLFESYGIGKRYESHKKSTTYLLRFLKYRKSQTDQTNLAFKGHTDKSLVSILHSNHVKGLELRTKDGDWIHFEPSPNSFVVIAGDVCMAWSNDRIRSCYHRVIVDGPEVRYALGLFSFLTGIIQTPEELVDEEHPLQYKPFDHPGVLQFYLASTDQNKGDRNMMKVFCGV